MGDRNVTGVDISSESIVWANRFFPGPKYICGDIAQSPWEGEFDCVVSLETIEHIKEPSGVLGALRKACRGVLVASVPNEDKYPFVAANFANDESPHYRHYKPKEFDDLLHQHGFKVIERFCQVSKTQPEVIIGTEGKFLVYACV
jgi:SAM-dependent methyltransferase